MTLHEPLSTALLADIDRQVTTECQAIDEAGRREAEAIVRQAHATARARVRNAIDAMRREGASRLRRAEAQRATQRRMSEEVRIGEMLRRACPRLTDVVLQRWQDAASRKLWIEAAARTARERILAKVWTVEHPADFGEADRGQVVRALEGATVSVEFAVSEEFAAGLRIRAEGALLDATPEALIGNRQKVESMLLAELSRAAAIGPGPTPMVRAP